MKDERIYLGHIREAISDIRAYGSAGEAAFLADRMRQDAIIRKLEIIRGTYPRFMSDIDARAVREKRRAMVACAAGAGLAAIVGVALERRHSNLEQEAIYWLCVVVAVGAIAALGKPSAAPARSAFLVGFAVRFGADLGRLAVLATRPSNQTADVLPPLPLMVILAAALAVAHGAAAAVATMVARAVVKPKNEA